ncbi:hypothetical protein T484DRAFT_1767277 [Baffinella frigidus]|nr:hypothetical protein T484DRAFT_1767277 [Cryptophyta sp. CCMP2293]
MLTRPAAGPGAAAAAPATTQQNLPTGEVWTPVTEPKSGGTYYWNQLTNETTMVGEPKPTGMQRLPPGYVEQAPPTFMGQMGGMFVYGAGITMGFAFVGALGRMFF